MTSFMINSGISKTYTCLWESQIATQSTNAGSSDDDDDDDDDAVV